MHSIPPHVWEDWVAAIAASQARPYCVILSPLTGFDLSPHCGVCYYRTLPHQSLKLDNDNRWSTSDFRSASEENVLKKKPCELTKSFACSVSRSIECKSPADRRGSAIKIINLITLEQRVKTSEG
ncbi:MAG: hypothetical protein ACTS44_01760 [Candidatus Hodgkinia cicadicola]